MSGFVLRNGHIIDPYTGMDGIGDIYVTADGKISGIEPEVDVKRGEKPEVDQHRQHRCASLDVTGCLVTPGLIDCHVHAYEYVTPLGINIDKTCLARGVATVVDAGSAGSSTVPGLLKFIGEASQTRLFCLLHIARHGLADAGCVTCDGGGECDSLSVVDVDACVKTIKANRDKIVGVKVRLARNVCDQGKNEAEVYRRALQASKECSVPLMVHHSISSIPLGEENGLGCPGDLQQGDIYTHCFHGHIDNIVDLDTGRVNPHVWDAKRRGVLFDVGHGQGSFAWHVAEQCASEGFWPDIISTDLHTGSQAGPAYDLVAVMSKMLHLGMPAAEVIRAVTNTPARAIGKDQEIGSLTPGRQADITVLKLEDISQDLEDSCGEMRTLKKAFKPVRMFVSGTEIPVAAGMDWPNLDSVKACKARTAVFRADEIARKK
ncbi:hypothetical protein RRG08_023283 [Elysia crispata]|uniref:Amidohydrolase-related domain-containing protein n=1 Tax=Elysia crispata TaxID=231223 RepID=A0AAE1EDF7_9GAST|nr:hypothetical protein RRG08_023283 [Elysia crispata]